MRKKWYKKIMGAFQDKRLVLTIIMVLLVGLGNVSAHPWGGLVIDAHGNIYFTFISPFVDDHHYACVWEINDRRELQKAFESKYSPSDIIVSRTFERHIYAAERSNASGGYQAQLWKVNDVGKELLIPPTTNKALFYIQAYAVTDEGTIFFALNDKLYQRTKDGSVRLAKVNGTFERIDDMAWGPNEKLYIIDKESIKILELSGEVSTLVTGLKEENPEALPFSGANILFDLAVDEKGNVYVAYYGNRKVLKVAPDGKVSDFLYSRPWSPHGVDVYNGEVYVLESTIGSPPWWKFWEKAVIVPRVRKVDTHGKVSTVFEYRPDK